MVEEDISVSLFLIAEPPEVAILPLKIGIGNVHLTGGHLGHFQTTTQKDAKFYD